MTSVIDAHEIYLECIVPANRAGMAIEMCRDLKAKRDEIAASQPNLYEPATYVHGKLPDGSEGIFLVFDAGE